MELKTTNDNKELLTKAAAMSGLDTSAFVLSAAVDRAHTVIADYSAVRLSLQAQRRFAELIANPPKGPTKAMKKLAALADLPVRRK